MSCDSIHPARSCENTSPENADASRPVSSRELRAQSNAATTNAPAGSGSGNVASEATPQNVHSGDLRGSPSSRSAPSDPQPSPRGGPSAEGGEIVQDSNDQRGLDNRNSASGDPRGQTRTGSANETQEPSSNDNRSQHGTTNNAALWQTTWKKLREHFSHWENIVKHLVGLFGLGNSVTQVVRALSGKPLSDSVEPLHTALMITLASLGSFASCPKILKPQDGYVYLLAGMVPIIQIIILVSEYAG